MCKQEPGEAIRSYVKRFFNTRGTIANVPDEDVIHYFHDGITTQSLYRDFGRNCTKTVVELRDMMQCWTNEVEQERSRFPAVTTTTTMGSATIVGEAPVISGTLCANVSQTMSVGLLIVARSRKTPRSVR